MTYRFTLEPYKGIKSRYACPQCNHREKTLVRYIDTQTGEHLGNHVGRCNREAKCGYHYTPKMHFAREKSFKPQAASYKPNRGSFKPQAASYKPEMNRDQKACGSSEKGLQLEACGLQLKSEIPQHLFQRSFQRGGNNLTKWLATLFDANTLQILLEMYHAGTSLYREGATIFWTVNIRNEVKAGKIILYNSATGRRVKKAFPNGDVTWVHCTAQLRDYKLEHCFFGEHLLNLPHNLNKPVAIAESEKTAMLAAVHFPECVWLAAGNRTGLTEAKCSVLKGRTVILFPDLDSVEEWSKKAKELKGIARFSVSRLLERKASLSEKEQGLDLGDWLSG